MTTRWIGELTYRRWFVPVRNRNCIKLENNSISKVNAICTFQTTFREEGRLRVVDQQYCIAYEKYERVPFLFIVNVTCMISKPPLNKLPDF